MRAGLLNKVIKFIDNTYEVNDYGEETIQEHTEITTRARVVFKGDNRMVSNNEVVNIGTLEFTVRDLYAINHHMIIEYNSKNYRILGIDDTIKGQLTIIAELIND
jgi:head-tail adaptor